MINELNSQHGLGTQLVFAEHPSGLAVGKVDTSLCVGSFFLHGAHLASFRPKSESTDLIFMSGQAVFADGKAIRGGVPICFPWFGAHATDPKAPAHGLVRSTRWEVLSTELEGPIVVVRLGYTLDALKAVYEIRFGDDLKLSFEVENTSKSTQLCELALHTYFDLQDAKAARVIGLESVPFFDKVTMTEQPASGKPIEFDRETDSVYVGRVDEIKVEDPARGRTIKIRPENSGSSIVWNPWIAKSQKMADFGDDEYKRMCCVETARVVADQMVIEAGNKERVAVTIGV